MPVVPIKSFADKTTEAAFRGRPMKGFPSDLRRVAQRKLTMVNAARTIEDLRVPPNNRLEKLTKDRAGQHSIRINDQFRVCFRWQGGDAHDVEIVDYH
jgi:proteic killer suppression protein